MTGAPARRGHDEIAALCLTCDRTVVACEECDGRGLPTDTGMAVRCGSCNGTGWRPR